MLTFTLMTTATAVHIADVKTAFNTKHADFANKIVFRILKTSGI